MALVHCIPSQLCQWTFVTVRWRFTLPRCKIRPTPVLTWHVALWGTIHTTVDIPRYLSPVKERDGDLSCRHSLKPPRPGHRGHHCRCSQWPRAGRRHREQYKVGRIASFGWGGVGWWPRTSREVIIFNSPAFGHLDLLFKYRSFLSVNGLKVGSVWSFTILDSRHVCKRRF